MAERSGSQTTKHIDGAMLAAIAEGLAAADPTTLLAPGTTRRWAPIAVNDSYSAWVIAWPAGTGLGLHDHDGSDAAVHVVTGSLRERFVLGEDLAVRWLDGGSTTLLPGDHRHEVVNVGATEAISVHVYSPPLGDTSFRNDPEIDLR
jgi:quercetin dioxygenase-like cupin family protein